MTDKDKLLDFLRGCGFVEIGPDDEKAEHLYSFSSTKFDGGQFVNVFSPDAPGDSEYEFTHEGEFLSYRTW